MKPVVRIQSTREDWVTSTSRADDDGVPSPLMGATKAFCHYPIFLASQLIMIGVNTKDLLQLASTYCVKGGSTAREEVAQLGEDIFGVKTNLPLY